MIVNRTFGLAVAALALALGGCATDRTVGAASGVEVAALNALPVPTSTVALRVKPQQSLDITVAGVEDLSGTFFVDENGLLTYPLVGQLEVNGMTPAAVARLITRELAGEYVLDPQVQVMPKDFAPQTVSVGGQVKSPGSYASSTAYSLLRTVNGAGGLAEYAKSDDVLVMRTVEGQKYIGVFNIAAISRGNYADPAIFPGDVVMVGESTSRRRILEILQFMPTLSSAVILIDRL